MNPRIAIVEDEPFLREELAFQLGHMGFGVETFADAPALYCRLAVATFAVVVLDIGLAGEDGLSICRHLREQDRGVGLVFVTARGQRDDRLIGLQAGADAYLTKPIDLDELNLVLRRLIERTAERPCSAEAAVSAPAQIAGTWRLAAEHSALYAPQQQRILLTLNEVRLLGVLMQAPYRIVGSRELALALTFLPDEFNKHRAEVILSRLRDKVLRETGMPLPVVTRRGQGYAFEP